jgi:uncharacterized repeat protein (TIGR01451 family)
MSEHRVCVIVTRAVVVIVTLLLSAGGVFSVFAPPFAAPSTAIQAPILKWQYGGCYASWCETGWYSSPAVADLDGDGAPEVIGAAYTLYALNGEDGSVQWSVDPEGGRVWPGVVVVDLDGDRELEILTAHGGGYVHVFDHAGNSVWSRQPVGNELRGLSVYDLDNDGSMEIVVTGAVYDRVNTWVLEHDGTTRSGWPQLSNESGYAYGVFNDNATVGDMDGDGVGEIVVPSDVHYICAYEENGNQIPAHAMYGGRDWGTVGVWESMGTELRGWGTCDSSDGRAERYRTNFAHGPAVIADVDGDGTTEVIATGNVYDCAYGHPPGKYNGVYIFNADRSRFNAAGYDWRNPPVDTGAPLSEDYEVIENNQPNPVVADLDDDGRKEILFASYDGRVHAYWLDKTEHYNWPYSVYTGGVYRFASEPVVADLDRNGQAEVIFASWVQKGTNQTGKLHILNYQGVPVHEIDLPAAIGSPDWNGALAAPTLADIDGDPDLELVLNTAHSGFVAYDLPGTADARVLWGTGRGNYQRTGSFLYGSLESSWISVSPVLVGPGDTLNYAIHLENYGPTLQSVRVTDTLPAEVSYLGDVWASAGSYDVTGEVITWWGSVGARPVTITFSAAINQQVSTPYVARNTVLIDDGVAELWRKVATAIVNGHSNLLPIVQKH